MSEDQRMKNELILSDGAFAYTQDSTTGQLKISTGPLVVNVTGQETPVTFDNISRTFNAVALSQAAQQSPLAPQGYYCVLWNPTVEGKHPNEKERAASPELLMGQRVNIPGPCTFALWPRQSAKVIEGHHLRSNQYLIVRVFDEEAAKVNWTSGVAMPSQTAEGQKLEVEPPKDLSVGRLLIIKGTHVSFYIPPTGLEVVQDSNGLYVRDAVSLERLDYCILIDEGGNKRYERGPKVIFPEPTEHFCESKVKGGTTKVFKPVELNSIQGIHIKVIAAYTEGGVDHKEGDELFITGDDMPIYFPQEEHSLISYDGRSKHFATAVPAGEARYVMMRKTGKIEMVKGPCMLLPDPRTEVIVRRALSNRQCDLWYPGNAEILKYNQDLRTMASRAPTTRSGAVSEGQVRRSKSMKNFSSNDGVHTIAESSRVGQDSQAVLADEFSRGSTYSQPRTITLNNKLSGIPTVNIWTGYAILVVSKEGERRVEVGPQTILLGYNETLEVLEMSTGKPKNTDHLLRTVYLRVSNNKISDVVLAETLDHVQVSMKLSLQVNFEGEREKWFQVENYVKFLTDHIRSRVKAAVRKMTLSEFYNHSEDIVRDTILGTKPSKPAKGETARRPGLPFEGNGMRVVDVDVLEVNILQDQIAHILEDEQHAVVREGIELASAQRLLEKDLVLEKISQKRAQARANTLDLQEQLERDKLQHKLSTALASINSRIEQEKQRLVQHTASNEVENTIHTAGLQRLAEAQQLDATNKKALQDIQTAAKVAETEATVLRLNAVQEGFSEALLALSNQDTLVKIAEALSVQSMLGGKDMVDVITRVFNGTPLEAVFAAVQAKGASSVLGNGLKKLTSTDTDTRA